jgi:hypothetical protein
MSAMPEAIPLTDEEYEPIRSVLFDHPRCGSAAEAKHRIAERLAEAGYRIVRADATTPDELVDEIFRLQNERDPDEDPGDLTIGVQDDSALHEVSQRGTTYALGGSVQHVLENALSCVRAGKDREPYYLNGWVGGG